MNIPATPLIDTLRASIAARRRALRFGWSRRKDHDSVTRALMLCEQFTMSYPNASDALVRNWCKDHHNAVACVVLGGRTAILYKLLGNG
jgi:hypothetical protein